MATPTIQPVMVGDSAALSWDAFKYNFKFYLRSIGKDSADVKTRAAILMNCIGEPMRELMRKWDIPDETYDNVDTLITLIDSKIKPSANPHVATMIFRNRTRQENESIDDYVNVMESLVKPCGYSALPPGETVESRVILDQIMLNLKDPNLLLTLVRTENLTLKKAKDTIKANESSLAQMRMLQNGSSNSDSKIDITPEEERLLDAMSFKRKQQSFQTMRTSRDGSRDRARTYDSRQRSPQSVRNIQGQPGFVCSRCGKKHARNDCPAYNQSCFNCSGKNHFANMCRSGNKPGKYNVMRQDIGNSSRPNQSNYNNKRQINEFVEDIFYDEIKIDDTNASLNIDRDDKFWYQKVEISNKLVTFKIDTGAQIDVMPLSVVKRLNLCNQIKETNVRIISYGGFAWRPIGCITLVSSIGPQSWEIKYLVVNRESIPLMSLTTALKFGLISRQQKEFMNCQISDISSKVHEGTSKSPKTLTELLQWYPQLFEGEGCFKGTTVTLQTDPNFVPVACPPSRFPLAIRDRCQNLMDELENSGIISKNETPTAESWINRLLVREKPNKELRVCLDPRPLNEALIRPYRLITKPQELVDQVKDHKWFTVLDFKHAFWHVKLDDKSSQLCSFATPSGIYKFNRLPFGLNVSTEIFQREASKIFACIPNVQIYIDDLLISGKTIQEHDRALQKVIEVALKNNVKFNPKKIQFRKESVLYLGYQLNFQGRAIKEDRAQAIIEIPTPKSKQALQSFLGLVNYVREFIPGMSNITSVFKDILKENVEFCWLPHHEQAFKRIKDEIVGATTLMSFDGNIPIQIQTDASRTGIACALMQAGKPIAYASRALSDTEKNYATIELEALAIHFACVKFHYYIYGRDTISVLTDHKPLVSVFSKPIEKLPLGRLRTLRCKVLHYNLCLQYVAGRYMYVADCLSRMFENSQNLNHTNLDVMVHANTATHFMSPDRLKQFKEQTQSDEELKMLFATCKAGWPQKVTEVPPQIRKYWSIKDELKIENDLLYLNYKMFVPKNLQSYIMSKIHNGHQGETRCKLLARKHFYWYNMSKDIELFIKGCEICQTHAPAAKKQSLLSYQIPDRPFQQVSTDIAHINGSDYLVLIDHFSKWLEIFKLRNKTAAAVQNALKLIFSQHGVPERLIGDNQPLNSKEMHEFAERWNFTIITSSPNYPQSNGAAEKAVQVASNLIKKCQADKSDLNEALLAHRATPIPSLGLSPSQILYSRQLRLNLPIHPKSLEPQIPQNVKSKLIENQKQSAKNYDRSAHRKVQFNDGQKVYIYNPHAKHWSKAQVLKKHEAPRSYLVQTPTGSILRRTAHHMKPDWSNDFHLPVQCQPVIPHDVLLPVTDNLPRAIAAQETSVHPGCSKNLAPEIRPSVNHNDHVERQIHADLNPHHQRDILTPEFTERQSGDRSDSQQPDIANHNSNVLGEQKLCSFDGQSNQPGMEGRINVEHDHDYVKKSLERRENEVNHSNVDSSPHSPNSIASPDLSTGHSSDLLSVSVHNELSPFLPSNNSASPVKKQRQASKRAREKIAKLAKTLSKNSSDSNLDSSND